MMNDGDVSLVDDDPRVIRPGVQCEIQQLVGAFDRIDRPQPDTEEIPLIDQHMIDEGRPDCGEP